MLPSAILPAFSGGLMVAVLDQYSSMKGSGN